MYVFFFLLHSRQYWFLFLPKVAHDYYTDTHERLPKENPIILKENLTSKGKQPCLYFIDSEAMYEHTLSSLREAYKLFC